MTNPQPRVSGVDFVTVFVADFATASAFYETTLGRVEAMDRHGASLEAASIAP